MYNLVDLNFHVYPFNGITELMQLNKESLGYIPFARPDLNITVVNHLKAESNTIVDGTPFYTFKSKNRFWYIPFKTIRFVQSQNPDVVLVQGLLFPMQVMALRFFLGKLAKRYFYYPTIRDAP